MYNISKEGTAVLMATHNYSFFETHKSRTLKCDRGYLVEASEESLAELREHAPTAVPAGVNGSRTFRLSHKRKQFPHRPKQSLSERADYCYGMAMRGATLLPEWTPVSRA